VPTISSIAPPTWYVGEANSFTVTGTNFDFGDLDSSGDYYCSASMGLTVAGKNVPTDGYFLAYSSSTTQTDGTAMIADDAPIGAATFSLEFICDPGANMPCPNGSDVGYVVWKVSYPVQLVCPIPNIISVTPSVWFAGNTYDKPVVITGTGFVTNNASAKNTCPVTAVTIAGADGSPITVGSVTVDSKTKITISGIAPPASSPTQTATITAGTAPNTGTFNTAQILGNIIQCGPSMPVCGKTTISAPHDPPPVIVGQQIALVANPDLPSSITPVGTQWTVGGTRIAGYNPSAGPTDVTPLKAADLKNTTVTFYWPYTETAVPVTYKYCVDITGANPVRQCSPDATATFEVDGPTGGTMSFTPFAPAVTISNLTVCTDSHGHKWPGGPWMYYATGVTGLACPGEADYPAFGITFNTPTGYANDSGGSYSLVQLISSDTTTGESSVKSVAGLDTEYPYGGPPSSDSPKVYLQSTARSVTRTFSANMFLMWQSNTSGSIPVPLGYQTWGFSGTATCSTSCGTARNWTAANTKGTTPGPAGSFVPSSASQTLKVGNNPLVDGYPTWTRTSQ